MRMRASGNAWETLLSDASEKLADLDALLTKVGDGDRAAFDAVYARTATKLFSVAVRILRDRHDAEEAFQETYVRVWRGAGSYQRQTASPMSWLLTIARNAAIDRLRRRRRIDETVELTSEPDDDAPDPEASAIAADDAARLQACLDELESGRAELIRQAYFQGASYAELAKAHGTPLGTVKSWMRRSFAKLRLCLEGGLVDERGGPVDE